ncbi:Protein CREG1 [Chionoecetes opilio]|uniref:Protein CREG1 n=1 Tax=Chionoecetes opilio TaxID=41210 RepID=A0A8J4Y0L2_CHIOP|nr:Protein CREG1 [Chionoecetes opilio]
MEMKEKKIIMKNVDKLNQNTRMASISRSKTITTQSRRGNLGKTADHKSDETKKEKRELERHTANMSKLEPPYSALGHHYTMKGELPTHKCRYFFFGFIIALVLILMSGSLFQLYLHHNRVTSSSGAQIHTWPGPPPYDQVARVARYVVHISEWASIATVSTAGPIAGYPFGNIISMSDGPVAKASGTPYAYITRMDLSGKDLMKNPRATLSMSEAQSDYCQAHDLDPEDPRCARVLLTGTMVEVMNGTAEADFARSALFSRHPAMESWPIGHHWIIVKLNIAHIYVLDFYGGANEVDVVDYYNAEV